MSKAVVTSKIVKPILSSSPEAARRSVLAIYKEMQRKAPNFWWDYRLQDVPLPVLREVLKNEFLKQKHIQDVRIIDRKVAETREHLNAVKYNFYTPYMVRNMLFGENIDPKPKDFLSRFLLGKD